MWSILDFIIGDLSLRMVIVAFEVDVHLLVRQIVNCMKPRSLSLAVSCTPFFTDAWIKI